MERLRDGDWDGLADHVRSRRDELGLSQDQLAIKAKVSRASVQSVERGESHTRWPHSLTAIERALEWEPGAARGWVTSKIRPTAAAATAPPRAMNREVKDEWRRQVEASPMSRSAKRENLEFIDSIPDAD